MCPVLSLALQLFVLTVRLIRWVGLITRELIGHASRSRNSARANFISLVFESARGFGRASALGSQGAR